jgi:putative transposase
MPYRSIPFATGEYYHIYNRGVAYQPIFRKAKDYERFVLSLHYYQFKNIPIRLSKYLQKPQEVRTELFKELVKSNDKIVDLIAFCLMPNHFHFLIKQDTEDGISKYMRLMTNSYARYFNTKYKRVGSLFQGMFKLVHVENDEQLLHLSRYIHLNPLVSFIVKEQNLISYPWSSLGEYIKGEAIFANPTPILSHFSVKQSYLAFVLDQADYGKKLEKIKHLKLE